MTRRFVTFDNHHTYQTCDVMVEKPEALTIRTNLGLVLAVPRGTVVKHPRCLL